MTANRTKIMISVSAILLILIRLLWPQITVDAITLGLLVVAALPWFAAILESAELPGGWKLEFRKLDGDTATETARRNRYLEIPGRSLCDGC